MNVIPKKEEDRHKVIIPHGKSLLMPSLFYNFPKNILKCFRGYNLLWHLLAIMLTYFISSSGADWLYFESSRGNLVHSILFPAVRLGSRVPIVAPLVLYAAGRVARNWKTINTAGALGQSALIGLIVSSFYKAFTGRAHPPRLLTRTTIDISRDFKFGFMRGGVFWGWPSSHTTIAFAMAMTLLMLYPRNKVIRYLAIFYAFYIGLGVSVSIHWFSDFAAGAVIGTVIGVVVGKSFSDYIVGKTGNPSINTNAGDQTIS
jgi:membrane-associated phospholipid phosphatase